MRLRSFFCYDLFSILAPLTYSTIPYVLGLAPWTTIEEEWLPYIPKSYLEYCQTMRGEVSGDEDGKELERIL